MENDAVFSPIDVFPAAELYCGTLIIPARAKKQLQTSNSASALFCESLLYAFSRAVYAWPLRANVASSTKPEVHKILQRRQNRTESCLQATCVGHLIKFGDVV